MAATEIKPIRTKRDYDGALKEVERLSDTKLGAPEGDRLDVLATLVDAYETEHYPMDSPDPVEAIKSGTSFNLDVRTARAMNRHQTVSKIQ